ncbi:acetyltransferase [Loktanella sp. Alg231-35]|uniref:acetyltransferase n=1 Tax=Loktanella sp. Alg231-35 TaxID=1922220 RepID=UPI000D551DF3|nr:acetyltransferase [Loktanella sp. Alg231-35]
MTAPVDVTANRAATSWSHREKLGRALWALAYPLFGLSPRPLWGWRRWLLRRFGAQIGAEVHVYPSTRIAVPWHLQIGDHAAIGDRAILYALGRIEIGARATVSQNAHLCAGTHAWREPARPLIRAAIVIGEDAWICADAFVGPGVQIGAGAVLGARGVAMRDLAPGHIGAGNPMQVRSAK